MRYLIIVLLAGCAFVKQHPKDGDIYENKLSRDRVEIDVNKCGHLNFRGNNSRSKP